MRLFLFILFWAVALVLFGCNQVSDVISVETERLYQGLPAEGPLYVFPIIGVGEERASSRLVIANDSVIREEPIPRIDGRIGDDTSLHFDRIANTLCGVFVSNEDVSRHYSCFDYASKQWQRISPEGYMILETKRIPDRRSVFMLAQQEEAPSGDPAWFVFEVSLENATVTNMVALHFKNERVHPQHFDVSSDGDIVAVVSAQYDTGYILDINKPFLLNTHTYVGRHHVVPSVYYTGRLDCESEPR